MWSSGRSDRLKILIAWRGKNREPCRTKKQKMSMTRRPDSFCSDPTASSSMIQQFLENSDSKTLAWHLVRSTMCSGTIQRCETMNFSWSTWPKSGSYKRKYCRYWSLIKRRIWTKFKRSGSLHNRPHQNQKTSSWCYLSVIWLTKNN